MVTQKPPAMRRGRGRPRGPDKVLIPVRVTPDLRKRFKTACAEAGQTYGEWIEEQLNKVEARKRAQQRAQAHPLHQPTRKSHYPGGGV